MAKIVPHWKMHDSSIPPSKPLPGFKACAGYIGGDTPHTWTDAEWARFKGFPKLPIYVNDGIGQRFSDGERDAWAALDRLFRIGCKPGHPIAYDLETRIVPDRVKGFRAVLEFMGFDVWVYGSISTVFRNPAKLYWPAHYQNSDAWPRRDCAALQYQNSVHVPGEPDIDISRVRVWQVLNRMWR